MCGRFTLSISDKPDVAKLGLQSVDRFNIAPQSFVVIQTDKGDHALAKWGIPLAAAGAPHSAINARLETLGTKPLFRDLTRCVLLTDGWYEWQRFGASKLPWYHHRRGELFYMAGIYKSGIGCAVVTQNASELLTTIHHRQPVLLKAQHLKLWLDGMPSEELPTVEVSYHPVSTRVGDTRHDDRELIEPVQPDDQFLGQSLDLFLDYCTPNREVREQ